MTTLGNKEIMARNIQKYMKLHDISRTDLCDALGVKYTTLTDWINGKTYPRIDKIEKMANYFNIRKSDLVESSPAITPVPVSLSSEEHAVVTGYRAADQPTKTVVKRLLNVEYEEPILNAAHDMGATEEEKRRADDIMMNDDEWK